MSKIKKIQLQPDNVTYDIDLPDNNPIKLNTVYSVMSASSVAGNTTAATYLSVRWYVSGVEGITAPYDGMKIVLKIPRAGASTVGVVLSLNGNTNADYHPVAYNVNGVLTTPFSANSIKLLTYDASATMDCYITSGTKSTVTGVWKTEADYDSNTTTTYGTLEYYFRPYTAQRLTAYKLVALDEDNRVVPITTEQYTGSYSTSTTYAIGDIVKSDSSYYRSKVNSNKNKAVTNTSYWEAYTMPTRFTPNTTAFKPEKIWFYNTTGTVATGSAVGGQTLTAIGYSTSVLSYTFWASCPSYRMIYLAGTYNKTTGLFTLDSSTYYVLVPDNTANLALNSYFTSGKDYILVGSTYSSANYFQLFMNNPMFHFDGTNLVSWNTWNAEQSGGTEDTWRGISVNGTALLGNAISTGGVNFKNGSNVTISGSGNDITINSSYNDTNYYPIRSYTSGLKISTNNGINSYCELYVPYATDSQYGVVKVAAVRSTSITATTGGTTSDRYYGVEKDYNGKLFVNVPWEAGGGGTTVESIEVEEVFSGNLTGDYSLGSTSGTFGNIYIKFDSAPTSNTDFDVRFDKNFNGTTMGFYTNSRGIVVPGPGGDQISPLAYSDRIKLYLWCGNTSSLPLKFCQVSCDGLSATAINLNYSYTSPLEIALTKDMDINFKGYQPSGGGGAGD